MLDVLLLDDDPAILLAIGETLRAKGYRTVTAFDQVSAQAALATRVFDVIICNVHLSILGGLSVFRKVRRESPSTKCILMTAYANVGDAVSAMKDGSADYLAKPFNLEEVLFLLARIEHENELAQRYAADQEAANEEEAGGMIGRSPAMMRLRERIAKLACSDAPLLITGETGTGKELVARAVHEASPRKHGPFVALNCAAFPDTLLEAELFGHERGAFTGAVKKREGRFKAAEGGTLLLDEVAELPLAAQAKLLRVLQEGTYEALGTNHTEHTNVRVVSATHRKLKQMSEQHLFREDLFYRLNTLTIDVPPLRERNGDRFLLLQRLLQKVSHSAQPPAISARALSALSHYPFPGNVRELSHAVELAVALSDGQEIDLKHLPAEISGGDSAEHEREQPSSLPQAVREFEREYVRRALKETHGSRTEAARQLGISRKTLWEKLRAYGLADADCAPAKALEEVERRAANSSGPGRD